MTRVCLSQTRKKLLVHGSIGLMVVTKFMAQTSFFPFSLYSLFVLGDERKTTFWKNKSGSDAAGVTKPDCIELAKVGFDWFLDGN